MSIDYEKINAKINFTKSEIDILINALVNMSCINIYNPDGISDNYKKPYNRLLDELCKIREDLIDAYESADVENNVNVESINPDYNREC